MAKWNKETWDMVASHLASLRPWVKNQAAGIVLETLFIRFVAEFGQDNPTFDRDRFCRAVFGKEKP